MQQNSVFRPKQVAAYLGIAPSTLYRWAKDPTFPPKLKLGPAAAGWRKDDLDRWLASREERR